MPIKENVKQMVLNCYIFIKNAERKTKEGKLMEQGFKL